MTGGSEGETITLQEAADRLGVHYQTAYKWVRDGTLAAEQVGRSYRLTTAEVDRWADERSTPKAPPARRPDLDAGVDRLFELLVAGDEATARAMVETLVAQGTTATIVAGQLLAPVMGRIGVGWERDEVSVSVEHRATAIAERILADVMPNPRGRRRGTAVVAGPSGERHGLASLMAAVALRDDNWRVEHLGADVPVDEIERFCDEVEADLVVLTVISDGTDRADRAELISQLENGGRRVLVGAPGATLDDLVTEAAHK